MNKSDVDIQVLDDALVVSGEKRFEREATEGRWHVLQCDYGNFLRSVAVAGAVVLKGDHRMRSWCPSPTST